MKIGYFSRLAASLFLCSTAGADEVSMPLIYGHRGNSELAQQNTMRAFKTVWKNGGKGVELDIHTSADGKLVIFHDGDFSRLAGDKRKVCELTYEEIKKIDVGSSKHQMFKGEYPPLLEDFFAAMPKDTRVLLELKATNEDFPLVLRDLMKKYNIDRSQVTVISFSEEQLKNLNQKYPGLKNMLCVGFRRFMSMGMKKPGSDIYPTLEVITKKLKDIGCTGVSLSASDKRVKLDKRAITYFKDAGYEVCVWTLNDIWLIRKFAEAGAAIVITDRPISMEFLWKKLFYE